MRNTSFRNLTNPSSLIKITIQSHYFTLGCSPEKMIFPLNCPISPWGRSLQNITTNSFISMYLPGMHPWCRSSFIIQTLNNSSQIIGNFISGNSLKQSSLRWMKIFIARLFMNSVADISQPGLPGTLNDHTWRKIWSWICWKISWAVCRTSIGYWI